MKSSVLTKSNTFWKKVLKLQNSAYLLVLGSINSYIYTAISEGVNAASVSVNDTIRYISLLFHKMLACVLDGYQVMRNHLRQKCYSRRA